MKDLATGLSIAPLSHFPVALRDAVLRGQRGTPLVFFAEIARKLSANGKRRGEKLRLILINAETINVFDQGGVIKRRAKIADVAAIHYTPEREGYTATVATSGPARKLAAAGGAGQVSAEVHASVALVIAGGYDMAFDVVAAGPHVAQPAEVIGSLIRVVSVLQRRDPKILRELRVFIAPATLSTDSRRLQSPTATSSTPPTAANFEDNFVLKKAARGGPPLIPPSLEMLSDDAERQKSADAKLQIDEAISDIVNELDKYKKENWATRSAKYVGGVQRVAASRSELERQRGELQRLEGQLVALTATNERRAARLHGELSIARKQFLHSVETIADLRATHEQNVARIREATDEAERRAQQFSDDQVAAHANFVQRLRALEAQHADLLREHADVQRELEIRGSLPTIDDVRREIADLDAAAARVQEAIAAAREADELRGDVSSLAAEMAHENSELERDVLALRQVARERDVETQQLLFQVSSLDAKRRRLAADRAARERRIEQMRDELCALAELEAQKQTLLEMLELNKETLTIEAAVCGDLSREATIHDSITASVAKIALESEFQALDEERVVGEELQRLRDMRMALISRSATPSAAQSATSATPRTPTGSRGTPRTGGDGGASQQQQPQQLRQVFRDPLLVSAGARR